LHGIHFLKGKRRKEGRVRSILKGKREEEEVRRCEGWETLKDETLGCGTHR